MGKPLGLDRDQSLFSKISPLTPPCRLIMGVKCWRASSELASDTSIETKKEAPLFGGIVFVLELNYLQVTSCIAFAWTGSCEKVFIPSPPFWGARSLDQTWKERGFQPLTS
jgi:hypothetical protein